MSPPTSLPEPFGTPPSRDPLRYPGTLVHRSVLLVPDKMLLLRPRRQRRLPQWWVMLGGERLPGDTQGREQVPLSHALFRLNQAPMAQRVPLLAVGSNAAPAQLQAKFADHGVGPVLPVIQSAQARGLAVGLSAHVSKPGYLPFTPVLHAEAVSDAVVLFPTVDQLASLDQTEPNYHRVRIEHSEVSVVLPSGEALPHVYAYMSRHGYLLDEQGDPWLVLDGFRQEQILRRLLRQHPGLAEFAGGDPEAFVRHAGTDPEVRERVRKCFQEARVVGGSALLTALVERSGGSDATLARPVPVPYSAVPPAHPLAPGALRVLPSADGFRRHGETTVRVAPEVADRLGGRHVLVSIAPTGDVGDARIKALSRVQVNTELRGTRLIEVDQVVRNAIGVEIGEDVVLTPVRLHRLRRSARLTGLPNYITCRVQVADLATVEKEVCLLDELTLSLLGVQPGDEVVVEGVADESGMIREVRIKAYLASEVIRQRREHLEGGDLGCRFPSALDVLAVFPDLPWVFLDSSTRTALGLHGQDLATVRIRASRSYQLRKEIRELLLVVSVAALGLASLFEHRSAQALVLVGLLLFVVSVVLLRLRERLRHELRGNRSDVRHHPGPEDPAVSPGAGPDP